MSIETCLAKLVASKRVTQKAADDALALYRGVQDRLIPHMPPGSADAASALEVARAMHQAAKERKFEAAQQAIRNAEIDQRMRLHGNGKTAGLIGAMTRDIYDDPNGEKINVESLSDAITQQLLAKGRALVEGYVSKWGGLARDNESVWNVIREGYGVDTGDQLAKQAWSGWDSAVKEGTDRVRRGGKRLHVRDDWRFMQFWETSRVRRFQQKEFVDDLMREYQAGGMRVRDKATGDDAGRLAVPGIIANAYDDIFYTRGAGGAGGGFSNQMRVFQFDDPEAYIRMMKKYGTGDGGLYNAFLGHLHGMAREIAWVEVFGPKYEAAFGAHLAAAREADPLAGKPYSLKRIPRAVLGSTPAHAQRVFDFMTGRLSLVESEALAGIFGGLRNLATSARLGSAFVSAIPGDTVTAGLAAHHVGMAPTAVLKRLLDDLVTDRAAGKEIAAQLGLTASSVSDAALGTKRFADEIVGQGLTGRLAEFVIRAQGLQAWTEGLKRAFSMEFMGLIARQADHKFEATDPAFRKFLTRYGFTPAEWDALRATPQIEANGARFFDPAAVVDRRLADRLLSGIVDERQFAVIEPNARVRAMTAGGAARGTLMGEISRSAFLFKSFSMSIMMTHLMRGMTQGPWWERGARMAGYMTTMTIAGAAAQQAFSLITGKDPQDMSDPRFWGSAIIRGGGLGFYGDFLYSAHTRGESGVYEALAGPLLGTGIEALSKGVQGKIAGKDLARYVKSYTPGSTLWYSRAATDRLIFDQIMSLVDRDYRKSFDRHEKRIKKEFGQGFWWRPGQVAPARAPNLGDAFGG